MKADIVIVGSGIAAVAVARRILSARPQTAIWCWKPAAR